MSWLIAHAGDLLNIASSVVATASAVAAVAPNPQANAALVMARKVVDFLALNFGNAKNR